MTARVAPVALARVVRPGLPLACLAEGVGSVDVRLTNGSVHGFAGALVLELVGGAFAGRDVTALADIDRLIDRTALPIGIQVLHL